MRGGTAPSCQTRSVKAAPAACGSSPCLLVDVTADWCLTCKLNKAVVLDRGPVQQRLAAPGIVAMRADWTRPDPAISAYLARFQRFGIHLL